MPLKAFLKTSDNSRISSVSPGGPEKRKRILPITKFSESMYVSLYVLDCSTHTSPTPSIKVELWAKKAGGGWEPIGEARCCPLCWKILDYPVGFKPRKISKQKLPANSQAKRRENLAKGRAKPRKKGFRPATQVKLDRILDMVESEDVSAYDVAEQLGIVRSLARRYLQHLATTGKILIESQGAGRGRITLYKKAP